jgi:hypothetical protein
VNISEVKDRYPWPNEKPDIPFDGQGWFCNETVKAFEKILNEDTKLVIELGSWLGLSSRTILHMAPNATLICIDTWEGSPEHHLMPEVRDKLPTLYETFLSNCWEFRERLIPIQMTSQKGLFNLASLTDQPAMVYIDASHEENDVYEDTAVSRTLFPKATIVGDDWSWPSVRRGVIKYTFLHNVAHKLIVDQNCWLLLKGA